MFRSKNSDKFLSAFRQVETQLRKIAKTEKHEPFPVLVTQAAKSSATVDMYRTDLLQYARLRNAIVHDHSRLVIAEPNMQTVQHMEKIAELLTCPPRVLPAFARKVTTFPHNAPISKLLTLMSANHFSQVPIMNGPKFIGLLTAETIAFWLGYQHENDPQNFLETPAILVLKHAESFDNCLFVSAHSELASVIGKFREFDRMGKKLDSVLITDSGLKTTDFVGIITGWDLGKAYEILQ